ncbi:thioesterase family protein [Ferruginibacter albus]|uniref:thioesterase family protein n=1 Tax=Ferruginibacter albus TaxID=2875540 RepID=UPI001CC6C2F7|nr:hypothetical protein [Ferruginibacter albus]UAY51456.1 hypothetical protein K9M53_12765 [Ferruginibacter albus]
MKNIFKKGDTKTFTHTVMAADVAAFENQTIHEVYSTFALARDAEYCSRLFLLDMKEADEEGIGVSINIEHIAPAFIDDKVIFTSLFEAISGNKITCHFEASANNAIIAKGTTAQKIVKKEKLKLLHHRT